MASSDEFAHEMDTIYEGSKWTPIEPGSSLYNTTKQRTRHMTPELLEKLELAREKARELRLLNGITSRDTRAKEAIIKQHHLEAHRQKVENEYASIQQANDVPPSKHVVHVEDKEEVPLVVPPPPVEEMSDAYKELFGY
jgi:hypothetical protein